MTLLTLSKAVLNGHAGTNSQAEYIAFKSKSNKATPFIPWTILKVQKDLTQCPPNTLMVNPTEFSILKPIEVDLEIISAVELTHIVLTTSSFADLNENHEKVYNSLPQVIRAGMHLTSINALVVACEPVDQGIISPNTTISVLESVKPKTSSSEIDFTSFLQDTEGELNLQVLPLKCKINDEDILPPAFDTECVVFAHLTTLAKLGVFSGDKVKINNKYVYIHSHPLNNIMLNTLYVPPMLFNALNSETVLVQKVNNVQFKTAQSVTLARVSSPLSTEKINQSQFLMNLKHYFSKPRVVANNDLIAIPISTEISKLFANFEDEEGVELILKQANFDESVFFEINGLPTNEQYTVTSSLTKMVQHGVVQRHPPRAKTRFREYLNLKPFFNYTTEAHALKLRSLLNATTPTSILIKSFKRKVGKKMLVQSLSAELGKHVMVIDSLNIILESDTKTLAMLKARLERASLTNDCVVLLTNIEFLSRKNSLDGSDTSLSNLVCEILAEFNYLNLCATCNDVDAMTDSVRAMFKFEVEVNVPTESERVSIFRHLFRTELDVVTNFKDVCLGFEIRSDININSLSRQSAGLTPLDLKSILIQAKQAALERADRNSIISCCGRIKITPQDFEQSISEARGKFSDAIGAPKIPNVSWKDVGGLDIVKGEILDTIEMPLKHPELFASGLKKRSGILFYGPPGTGKTLLAKAIATNFSLNFLSVKGPELLNMYIGESEANVRRIFQKARDAKPCVVFFDELDSIAPKRGNKGDSGGVMDRIVSQLLAELDGMNASSEGVFCVGATNRPDLLDEALLRPGRFDKLLYLGISDTHLKQQTILKALTRKFTLGDDVDLHRVAEMCPFTYTGADFYALSSDAMLNAMTRTANKIDAKVKEHPEKISVRKWFQTEATEEDIKVRVQMEDFQKAINELVPSVSADELEHYLRVRDSFEAK